jgi:putative endonuclease
MDTCLPVGRECKIPVMNDYWVYAIKSEIDGRVYVGFTVNVEKRLKEHYTGQTKSTKGFRPWKIIFSQKVNDRLEARRLEKYYKSGIGKEKLKQIKLAL